MNFNSSNLVIPPHLGWNEPYPYESLPTFMKNVVDDITVSTQVPKEMAATAVMSAMALTLAGKCEVRQPHGAITPVSLYTLIEAESGSRKSAVDRLCTAGIRDWEDEQLSRHGQEMSKFSVAHKLWKDQVAQLKKRLGRLKVDDEVRRSAFEAQLKSLYQDEPTTPKLRRLIYTDATPIAVLKGLARHGGVGGLVSDEAGVVISKKIAGHLPDFNSLWDGQTVRVDRSSEPSFILQNPRFCMTLMVQPEAFKAFANKATTLARDSGFLARLLICPVSSNHGQRLNRGYKRTLFSLQDFQAQQKQHLASLDNTYGGHAEPSQRVLHLSRDAEVVWRQAFNEVESEQIPFGRYASAKDAASKFGEQAVRIAAVFSAWNSVGADAITAEYMSAGIAIARWHLNVFARMFPPPVPALSPIAAPPHVVLLDWLHLKAAAKGRRDFTLTELYTLSPYALRKKATLLPALELLRQRNHIQYRCGYRAGTLQSVFLMDQAPHRLMSGLLSYPPPMLGSPAFL